MAVVPTVLAVTPFSCTLNCAVDGNAAATNPYDILTAYIAAGGLSTSPFYTNIAAEYAAQANAQTAFYANYEACQRMVTATVTATDPAATLLIDANISGVGVKNFRLSLTDVKIVNADTATFIVVVEYRHSIRA